MIPHAERRALLEELARTEAGALVTCASASMQPTIAVGQAVRVRRVSLESLRVGDVVLFAGKDGFLLHRIVLIGPGRSWFLHIGDAPTPDGPRRARMSAIIGLAMRQRRRPAPRVYAKLVRRALRRYLP